MFEVSKRDMLDEMRGDGYFARFTLLSKFFGCCSAWMMYVYHIDYRFLRGRGRGMDGRRGFQGARV